MKRNTVYGAALLFSIVAAAGCDRSSTDPVGDRDGALQDAGEEGNPEVGGGFVPDPNCDYACEDINDEEAICSQFCADGCVTIELNRETANDEGISVVGSVFGYCPEDFPDDELGPLTCQLMYTIPSGGPSDCAANYSAQTCQAAQDVCLDGL